MAIFLQLSLLLISTNIWSLSNHDIDCNWTIEYNDLKIPYSLKNNYSNDAYALSNINPYKNLTSNVETNDYGFSFTFNSPQDYNNLREIFGKTFPKDQVKSAVTSRGLEIYDDCYVMIIFSLRIKGLNDELLATK